MSGRGAERDAAGSGLECQTGALVLPCPPVSQGGQRPAHLAGQATLTSRLPLGYEGPLLPALRAAWPWVQQREEILPDQGRGSTQAAWSCARCGGAQFWEVTRGHLLPLLLYPHPLVLSPCPSQHETGASTPSPAA